MNIDHIGVKIDDLYTLVNLLCDDEKEILVGNLTVDQTKHLEDVALKLGLDKQRWRLYSRLYANDQTG